MIFLKGTTMRGKSHELAGNLICESSVLSHELVQISRILLINADNVSTFGREVVNSC